MAHSTGEQKGDQPTQAECADFITAIQKVSENASRQHLSLYLNMILTREKYDFNEARNNRPFSLLELSLCLHLVPSQQEHGLVTERNPIQVCERIEETQNWIEWHFGSFISLRTMTVAGPNYFETIGIKDHDTKPPLTQAVLDHYTKEIHTAATQEVTFIRPGLRWFLENTQQGKDLLKGEEDLETDGLRVLSYRLRWLLIASLYEHTLLMPKAMREDAEPKLPDNKSSTGTARKLLRKVAISVGRSAPAAATSLASSTFAGANTQPVLERTYRPYQEHLKLAQRLPGLEKAGEEQLFPRDWRKQFSVEPEWLKRRQLLAEDEVRREKEKWK
ncbi:hypothetical protein QBC45DRAFT_426894 [Copromyces sp. CBS 386.78]|nr:hypothetical protein QBC45DRAFT_426894 [Copromyces sp. CBS 386.78]